MNQTRRTRGVAASSEGKEQLITAKGTLSFTDVASKANVSEKTVRRFFNGERVDKGYADAIINALDLSGKNILLPDNLLFEDEKAGEAIKEIEENLKEYKENADDNNKLPGVTVPTFANESESEDLIYVERPPIESICEQELCQPGALLRIKAPGLMGKTSLMNKVLRQLEQNGYRIVRLNLCYAEEKIHFNNLDKFLQWFCVSVGERLKMQNLLNDYWDDKYFDSKMNCKIYFENYLLKQVETPIVICLDKVERIFPYDAVAPDFLALLRAWHEDAKAYPIWQKLRLVIVYKITNNVSITSLK